MRKHFQGFTFIEITLSMMIIAILFAAAMWRYSDFSDASHEKLIDNIEAGLEASLAEIHSIGLAQGPTNLAVYYSGRYFFVDSSSYFPETTGSGAGTGTATGTVDGAMTGAECVALWNDLLVDPPSVGLSAGACTDGCDFVASSTFNSGDNTYFCDYAYQGDGGGNYTIRYIYPTGTVLVQ